MALSQRPTESSTICADGGAVRCVAYNEAWLKGGEPLPEARPAEK